MRKILLFSVLLSVLGCSSQYSDNDFIGEYILYSDNGNLLYNGEPVIKIYKEKDILYLTNLQNKDTVPMRILSTKEINEQDNLTIIYDDFKINIINGIDRLEKNKAYSIYKIKKENLPVDTDIFINSYKETGFLKKIK